MLFWTATQAADEIEPLDADFLEYLASMESDDDNWTLLDQSDHPPASKHPERERPLGQSAARKASKEAAKPAVDER
jgi:hypothetical protein